MFDQEWWALLCQVCSVPLGLEWIDLESSVQRGQACSGWHDQGCLEWLESQLREKIRQMGEPYERLSPPPQPRRELPPLVQRVDPSERPLRPLALRLSVQLLPLLPPPRAVSVTFFEVRGKGRM